MVSLRAGNPFRASSRFRTDALVTLLGSGGAQLVNVLAIPILSRLYTPGQFGIWATYLAVLAVLSILVTLRFDIAIVTARTHRLATEMFFVAALISVCLTVGLGLVLLTAELVFGREKWFSDQFTWLVWTPAGILGTALYTLGTSWWLRIREFRFITIVCIGQSLLNVLFQLIMFWMGVDTGLVVGNALGQIVLAVVICVAILPFMTMPDWRGFRFRGMAAMRRFKNLAFYTTPYSLQGQVFKQLVVVVLSTFASVQVAGLYAVSQRLAYNPLAVMGNAFQQPIYPRLAAGPRDPAVHNLIAGVLKRFAVVLGIGCALVTVFARPAIILVLGSKWADGAPYLVATCYAAASLVATSWLVRIFDIFGRQRLHLVFDFAGNLVIVMLFALVLFLTRDSVWAVAALSTATALYYAAWAMLAFHVAGMQQGILVRVLSLAVMAWIVTLAISLGISSITGVGLLASWQP